jgi:beta-lactam-binding protein with PASTA domain
LRRSPRIRARRLCRTGKIGQAYSLRVRKGLVATQKPKPGKRLANGAKVTFVLSRGKRH